MKKEKTEKTQQELDKVLAYGEVTGHYHKAVAESASLEIDGDTMVLDAPEGTEIVHQEHHTITVPPGQYERQIVNEYDPFEEEIRKVRD